MPSQNELIGTDYFGTVPRGLYYKLKRLNVSPADYDDIERALGDDWAAIHLHLDNNTKTFPLVNGKTHKYYELPYGRRISPTA